MIDDVPIQNLNLNSLRKSIGAVPQDAFLFSDTIKNNIKFGKDNATDEERIKMDADAFISLRIIRTGGEDFDLLVTKYTNSQNPIDERDFHSNDPIQKRIQEDFIRNTNICN